MSRLLGIVGRPPLPLQGPVQAFAALSQAGEGGDGWGFSGFGNERAVYFDRQSEALAKMPERIAAVVSRATAVGTPLLIGHLRRQTSGPAAIGNTHPFHYRDWVFAHDGTISDAASLDLGDIRTQGQTDSERFLVWLVEQVGVAIEPGEALAEVLTPLRQSLRFDHLTFLLSDGKTLWAYHEGEDSSGAGLHTTRLGSALVICSQPLKQVSASWQALPVRTLASSSIDNPSLQLKKL